MTEEELIEALAVRLYEVGETSPFAHGNSWSDRPMGVDSRYYRIARECLRQMAWAQRRCVEIDTSESEFARWIDDVRMLPITLAPEDWKP